MAQAKGARSWLSFLALSAAVLVLDGCKIEKNGAPTPILIPIIDKAIATSSGQQSAPHVAPTTDGGAWISWYDLGDMSTSFQMRLQRIDRYGNPLFTAPGLLVADDLSSRSYMIGYALLTDWLENAVVVFTDDDGDRFTVRAYKISPGGEFLWGSQGISLAQPVGYCRDLRAVLTVDQEVTISWTHASPSPNGKFVNVIVQRLSNTGSPRFGGGMTISCPHGKAEDSRLIASAEGSFILVWREIPSLDFGDDRGSIRAQRFDAKGAPIWPTPATIINQGFFSDSDGIQAVTDGRGGAFIAWNMFNLGFSMDSFWGYIQHITASNAPTMPAGGLPLSTEMTRQNWHKIMGYLGSNPETGEAVVNWKELDSSQNRARYVIDLFSMDGERSWEPYGRPMSEFNEYSNENLCYEAVGALKNSVAYVYVNPNDYIVDRLFADWISKDTNAAIETIILSDVGSPKFDFDIASSPLGGFWIIWTDQRADYGDIYAAFTPAPED